MVVDTKHGIGEHNRLFREHFNLHRLLLHASAVKFVHPVYHKEVLITSTIGGDFGDICEKFGWGSVLYAYE
jgi:tRNA pseudouridine65 synthase